MLTYPTLILKCLKEANTERPSKWRLKLQSCCHRTKKVDSNLWLESLKNEKFVLASPWKILECFVKKGVQMLQPCFPGPSTIGDKMTWDTPPPSPPCNVVPLFELPLENKKHPNFEWRGQGRGVDSYVSEVTLFEYNVSTILSPTVAIPLIPVIPINLLS